MRQALKTFKDMEKYIINSFDYEYSNGLVEGINNVIKQVKHVACGYKKFNHLKARVMLIKGLLNPIVSITKESQNFDSLNQFIYH